MQDIVKKLGHEIREIRLRRKMSQGDLAKILGVHPTYISGIERGLRNPSLLTIKKFTRALKIKLSDFFKGFD